MIGSGVNIGPINGDDETAYEGAALQTVCLKAVLVKVVTLRGVIQKC